MKFIRLAIFGLLTCTGVLSCAKESSDTPSEGATVWIERFAVTVSGTLIEATIDNVSGEVSIPGVTDGNTITDVSCELASGVSIYPQPSSFLGAWDPEESVLLQNGAQKKTFVIRLSDYQAPEIVPDATIRPGQKFGRVTKYHFYDLKQGSKAITEEAAMTMFHEQGLNGVRIPIYGDQSHGGHPQSGEVDASVYSHILTSVKLARNAYAKDDFVVFASKKLDGKNSFPAWVKDGSGAVLAAPYAQLLVDYLLFMKEQGIEVDVLGVDNEINFNEGNITASKYKNIVDEVRRLAAEKGCKVPLMIGPERYNPQGNTSDSWLKTLFDNGWEDRLDLYGTHYYPKHHTQSYFNKLQYEVNLSGDREFWATEPHWDNDDTAKADPLYAANQAMCAFWDQTDLGMDGFMWWSYSWQGGELRGNLMRALSLPLLGSQPIEVEDHDGTGTMDLKKFQTRAFLRDKEVNFYVINVTPLADATGSTAYENYRFGLDSGTLDGEVACTQWTDEGPVEGTSFNAEVLNETVFRVDIPERSITHIRFHLQ